MVNGRNDDKQLSYIVESFTTIVYSHNAGLIKVKAAPSPCFLLITSTNRSSSSNNNNVPHSMDHGKEVPIIINPTLCSDLQRAPLLLFIIVDQYHMLFKAQ